MTPSQPCIETDVHEAPTNFTIVGTATDPEPTSGQASGIGVVGGGQPNTQTQVFEPGSSSCVSQGGNFCQPIPGLAQEPATQSFTLGPVDASNGFGQFVNAWDVAGNISQNSYSVNVTSYSPVGGDEYWTIGVCQAFPVQSNQLIADIDGSGISVVIATVTSPGAISLFWNQASSSTAALQPLGGRVYTAMTSASYSGPVTIIAAFDGLLNGADPSTIRLLQLTPGGGYTDITQSVNPMTLSRAIYRKACA